MIETAELREGTSGRTVGDRASDLDELHRKLSHWNRRRLQPGRGEGAWEEELTQELEFRVLELRWIETQRPFVRRRAELAPTDPDAFIAWFEALKFDGPGQGDRLFPWLAEQATLDELRWFVEQEVAGEAGFDDLVAFTQVKLPTRPKLELARNYWDEMGRGREAGMHGPMLEYLAKSVDAHTTIERTVWQALALGNTLVGLATNRRYTLQSVGALGAVELTAPTRAPFVVEAMKRLGFGLPDYRYFALHAALDIKHSEAWNAEALRPLVEADPRNARAIAEGALLRLEAGARCFERYRDELNVP